MSTYAINKAVNGIEITFESKPAESIRDLMKANGFRWHKVKKIWYAKNTADRLQIAQDITSGNAAPAPAPAAIDMSDWGGEYGPGYMGGSCWKGSKSAHCMSYDDSNAMVDYFNSSFYYSLKVVTR